MSDGYSTLHPDPECGAGDIGNSVYARAGQMLDRYGVAYVCRYPEILLGIAPSVDSAYGVDAEGKAYCRNGRDMHFGPFARGRPNVGEDMLRRAIDAYRTLDEIFAPQPVTRRERHLPMGHVYGHTPAQAPGKPTRCGGWYC